MRRLFKVVIISGLILLATQLIAAENSSVDLIKQGIEYYNNRNYALAKQLAMQALAKNSRDPNGYILLGDVEYMMQNMTAARNAWQKAAELVPNNQLIKNRLDRISREADTEVAMVNDDDAFFNIKIDGDLTKITDFDLNQVLNNARIKVGTDLNYSQRGKIPVVVYTLMQYQDTLKDAPDWSEGAYDGKIRIILSTNRNYDLVASTIVHEYTHAVIDDLTNNNCPRWLNEGLAKYEEYRYGVKPQISVLALAYNTNNIIDWDKIDESFLSNNKSEVLMAYQQSYSFVYFLAQKYGLNKIRNTLLNLGQKQDIDSAINNAFQIPLNTLQKDWRTWLTGFINEWAESNVE